jgi:stage V sporulation protein AB
VILGNILSAVTGLCAGIVSGTALCAFYVALGVFSKSAESLGVNNAGTLMSVCAAAGGMLGTAITVFNASFPIGPVFAAIFGLFGGVYVGILIACLAEVTDAIPVVKNFGLTKGLIALMLTAFVLGKTIGALIYWLSGAF